MIPLPPRPTLFPFTTLFRSDTTTLSGASKPVVGSYTQTAGGIGCADSANYRFALFTSASNYTISQLALTGAAIAAGSNTYTSAPATGAVTSGNNQSGGTVTS